MNLTTAFQVISQPKDSWAAGVGKNRKNKDGADGMLSSRRPLSLPARHFLLPSCSCSVSKSLRIACFHSPVVGFLHVVCTMHKYAACWAGLQGRFFFHPAQVCLTSMATNLCNPSTPRGWRPIKLRNPLWISCWDASESVRGGAFKS